MKRLYIGGLPASITEKEIKERFCKYGEIMSVDVAKSCFDNTCRGFAHISIDLDETQWNKMRSVFNNSVWMGKKMRIEEAKETFLDKLQKEWQENTDEDKTGAMPKRKNKPLVCFSKQSNLVDEDNVGERKGWIRGKFGRPVAVVKLRNVDGSIVTVDPAHHKENFQRFYFGEKFLSVKYLHWNIEDFEQKPIALLRQKDALQDIDYEKATELNADSQQSQSKISLEEERFRNISILNALLAQDSKTDVEVTTASSETVPQSYSSLKQVFQSSSKAIFSFFGSVEEESPASAPVISDSEVKEDFSAYSLEIPNRIFFKTTLPTVKESWFYSTKSADIIQSEFEQVCDSIWDHSKRISKYYKRKVQKEKSNFRNNISKFKRV